MRQIDMIVVEFSSFHFENTWGTECIKKNTSRKNNESFTLQVPKVVHTVDSVVFSAAGLHAMRKCKSAAEAQIAS